jgi:Tfp pilus assembly protein PilW
VALFLVGIELLLGLVVVLVLGQMYWRRKRAQG